MAGFIDGEVDERTRREVGLHLADCEDCVRVISDDRFWDQAVLSLLDHEAPADLRAEILGDLAQHEGVTGKDLSALGWRRQLKIVAWASTRGDRRRHLLEAAAVLAVVLLVGQFNSRRSASRDEESFQAPGPVSIVRDGRMLSSEISLGSGSLSLDGRLF